MIRRQRHPLQRALLQANARGQECSATDFIPRARRDRSTSSEVLRDRINPGQLNNSRFNSHDGENRENATWFVCANGQISGSHEDISQRPWRCPTFPRKAAGLGRFSVAGPLCRRRSRACPLAGAPPERSLDSGQCGLPPNRAPKWPTGVLRRVIPAGIGSVLAAGLGIPWSGYRKLDYSWIFARGVGGFSAAEAK